MKRSMLLLGVATALCASASTPKKTIEGNVMTVPEFATENGKSLIISETEDQVVAYDENLEVVATVNVPQGREVTLKTWYQQREYTYRDATLIDTDRPGEYLNIDGEGPEGITLDQAIELARNWYGSVEVAEIDGETVIVCEFFREYDFGKKYPQRYFKLEDGCWYLFISQYQEGEYGPYGDWGEKRENSNTVRIDNLEDIYIDHNGIDYDDLCISQTIFNNDSQFEYVVEKCEIKEYSSETETHREGGQRLVPTGYSVMSQNGSKLFDIDIPSEYQDADNNTHYNASIFIIGAKKYFVIDSYRYNDNEDVFLFYELDGSGSVKAPKMVKGKLRANPTAPRKGEAVSIILGKASASATTLNVVSANGSTVRTLPIAAGQSAVTLPTEGLSSGLYIVTAGGHEAAKIIIR